MKRRKLGLPCLWIAWSADFVLLNEHCLTSQFFKSRCTTNLLVLKGKIRRFPDMRSHHIQFPRQTVHDIKKCGWRLIAQPVNNFFFFWLKAYSNWVCWEDLPREVPTQGQRKKVGHTLLFSLQGITLHYTALQNAAVNKHEWNVILWHSNKVEKSKQNNELWLIQQHCVLNSTHQWPLVWTRP